MQGVLSGFAVIAVVIGVGYLIGRRGYLGEAGREVLTKLAFHVASPALLFTTLAQADLSVIFSDRLLVTAMSTAAAAGVFVAVGAARGWGVGRTTIGALCSSYVNSGNLGIPIAVYVLGDASLVAPVLLFQLVGVTPVALTVLDLAAGVFGLRGALLLDVVVTSALPAAQNLFTYASSYRVGEVLAREAILLSTVVSVPVLVVVAAVLG